MQAEPSTGPAGTFALLLAAWDSAWGLYLEQFVAWKLADSASLEVCNSCWQLQVPVSQQASLQDDAGQMQHMLS